MSLRSSLRTEGISVRSIFTSVLVVVVTAFLWTILTTLPSQAQSVPSEQAATWNGSALMYDGDQYLKVGKADGSESHGVPTDATYYLFTKEASSDSTTRPQDISHKAYIIYISSGVDPPSATEGTFVEYDFNIQTKEFSNPSAAAVITIDPTESAPSSCVVEGIGWVVCPATNWLATGMDAIFEALTGFMEVQPIHVSNTSSGLYVAWDIMRNIANVAFIVVFLILVYAQLTSFGISNYGIKRMLPRLIIAAILVNLSYLISAIAVDISNILGYSLQDVFIQIRNQINDSAGNDWSQMTTWESISSFILSGGTAGLALTVGASAALIGTGGTLLGAMYLIIPILLGAFLAILTVVLILAARQAIITIFIVIAPLAFIAYTLPNTEKWFEKWKDTFMTMLIFFPAFSLVFGGSQLAATIIIQNANSINVILLGMAVQVAPLVITPLLIKLSGNLLGKIAGIVNNPNKGLMDRTRNWAGEQQERHRQRGISGDTLRGEKGTLRKRNAARYLAKRATERRNNLKKKGELHGSSFDNNYHAENKKFNKLHEREHELGLDKQRIDDDHKKHILDATSKPSGRFYGQNMRVEQGKRAVELAQTRVDSSVQQSLNDTSSALHRENTRLESAKASLEVEKMQTQRTVDEYKTGKVTIDGATGGANTPELNSLITEMSKNTIDLAAEARATTAAKQMQQKVYSDTIESNTHVRKVAAGNVDPNGEQRALAEAFSIISKNKKENIENIKSIISYKGLNDKQRVALVEGKTVDVIEGSIEARAAAIESLFEAASPSTIQPLVENIDFSGLSADDRATLAATYGDALGKSSLRPVTTDFGRIAKIKEGKDVDINGNEIELKKLGKTGTRDKHLHVISKKTLTVASMQGMFTPEVNSMVESLEMVTGLGGIDHVPGATPETKAKIKEGLGRLSDRLKTVLDPTRDGFDKLGDSEDAFRKMQAEVAKLLGQ